MRKVRPTAGLLASVAAALAVVAFLAWSVASGDGTGDGADLILGTALMLILELPAFWWRGRGGDALGTFAAALTGPLLVFGGFLAFSSWLYKGAGGDLQGIEQIVMLVLLVPILVTAALVSILALILVEPEEPAN